MYTNIIHNDDICNYFLKNQQFIFNSLGNCRECRLEPHHQFTDKLVLFADLRAAAGVPVFFVIESYVGGEQRVAYAEGEAYGHTVTSPYNPKYPS